MACNEIDCRCLQFEVRPREDKFCDVCSHHRGYHRLTAVAASAAANEAQPESQLQKDNHSPPPLAPPSSKRRKLKPVRRSHDTKSTVQPSLLAFKTFTKTITTTAGTSIQITDEKQVAAQQETPKYVCVKCK